MEIVLTPKALEDLRYWKKLGNIKIQNRISLLLKDISLHPYSGIGKPEALKYNLSGKWSRRIDSKHRIIYSVSQDIVTVYIFSMRNHY